MQRSVLGIAVLSVVAGLGISQASAATGTFTGASAVGNVGMGWTNWNDAANWVDGYIPVDGDKVIIQSRGAWVAVDMNTPRTVDTIDCLVNARFEFTGGKVLTLSGGNVTSRLTTSGSFGFYVPVVLNNDGIWSHEGNQNEATPFNIGSGVTGNANLELRGYTNWSGGTTYSVFTASNISLTGTTGLTVGRGVDLRLGYTAAGRLDDAMPVNLKDGMIRFSGASNTPSVENIGALSAGGRGFLTLETNGTGTSFINAASLTRVNRGTLTVRPNNNTFANLGRVGGLTVNGGIPMTNGMVAPWILGASGQDYGGGSDTNFLAYDDVKGLVPVTYTAYDETTINSAGSNDIVRLTKVANQPSLTADLTIKALKASGAQTLSGPGTLNITSGGLIYSNGTMTIAAPVNFGSEGVVNVQYPDAGSVFNLNGAVSGSDGLTFFGGAATNLGSSANTFTGPVTVSSGSLTINGAIASGDGVGLNRAGTVLPLRIDASGRFNANNRSQRVASLEGNGIFSGGTGTLTIVRDNAAVSDFSGRIIASAMNLVKQGNGTQILSGSNLLTGTTTVQDGILLATHNKAFGAGSLAATGGIARLQAGTGKALLTKGVSVSGTGQIDVTDSGMIVDYTDPNPLSAITGYLATGYAAGAWNGTGINSSVAAATPGMTLGVADNAVLGLTSFGGETVDSTSVLVKYVYSGDLNWDGVVDGVDLSLLGANWQATGNWAQGDMNYDGTIDGIDLSLLGSNWQAGVAAPLNVSFAEAAGAMGMSVPEPASLAVVGLGTLALGLRRRRHA